MCPPIKACRETAAGIHSKPAHTTTSGSTAVSDGLAKLVEAMHITSYTSSLSERAVTIGAPDGSGKAAGAISLADTAAGVSPVKASPASADAPMEARCGCGASPSTAAPATSRAKLLETLTPKITTVSDRVGAAKSDPGPLMLTRTLIIPERITLSLLQSLYERFKKGVFSFSEYAEVEKQTRGLLEKGRYSEEWIASLLHSAHQFAEFQTLKEHLPKTNDLEASDDKEKAAIVAKERTIISNLEKEMDRRSFDVSNAVTLYKWTLDQIVEQSIPPSEYVIVYRYVTNYVNTRTHGRDWTAEEKSVMIALSESISSRRININESDDRIVATQIEEWLSEIMSWLPTSAKEKDRISEKVRKYVLDLKAAHFAFKTKFASDLS